MAPPLCGLVNIRSMMEEPFFVDTSFRCFFRKCSIETQVVKILKQYKVGKHYTVDIRDDGFDYKIDRNALALSQANPGWIILIDA